MNINEITRFLVLVQEHGKPEHIVADLEQLLDRYKIPFYAIVSQPKPSPDLISHVLAGRWPQGWPERYIEKRYLLVDPTIRYLPHAERGYSWKTALAFFEENTQHSKMRKMLDDAKRNGLRQGYMFPIHSAKGLVGNMSVGGLDLDLSPVEISLFEQVAKLTLLKLLAFSGHTQKPEKMEAAEMTARELEILSYLADGRTSQDIANILNISNHTVDWHINSIQEKFRARNRQHAVATAFRRGLII